MVVYSFNIPTVTVNIDMQHCKYCTYTIMQLAFLPPQIPVDYLRILLLGLYNILMVYKNMSLSF